MLSSSFGLEQIALGLIASSNININKEMLHYITRDNTREKEDISFAWKCKRRRLVKNFEIHCSNTVE
jgi:hypothetical protein